MLPAAAVRPPISAVLAQGHGSEENLTRQIRRGIEEDQDLTRQARARA